MVFSSKINRWKFPEGLLLEQNCVGVKKKKKYIYHLKSIQSFDGTCGAHTHRYPFVFLSCLTSPVFRSYLSPSHPLYSLSFSPRVKAVAKKQIEEPVYALDMLRPLLSFPPRVAVTNSKLYSGENVRANQSFPSSLTSFLTPSFKKPPPSFGRPHSRH